VEIRFDSSERIVIGKNLSQPCRRKLSLRRSCSLVESRGYRKFPQAKCSPWLVKPFPAFHFSIALFPVAQPKQRQQSYIDTPLDILCCVCDEYRLALFANIPREAKFMKSAMQAAWDNCHGVAVIGYYKRILLHRLK
jgi:hypothetical protein